MIGEGLCMICEKNVIDFGRYNPDGSLHKCFYEEVPMTKMNSPAKRIGNWTPGEASTDCVLNGKWHAVDHGSKSCSCAFSGTKFLQKDSRCSIRLNTAAATGRRGCNCVYCNKAAEYVLPKYSSKYVMNSPKEDLDYNKLYWKYIYASGDSASKYLEKMLSKVTLDMQPTSDLSTWVSTPDPFKEPDKKSKVGLFDESRVGFFESYKKMTFPARFWIAMAYLVWLSVILHALFGI